MATWGSGPFDNDGAADLLIEIEDGTFSFEGVEWAFDQPRLDADGGQFALALLELALVALEARDPGDDLAELDLSDLAEALTPERVAWILRQAERTLAGPDVSGLYEQWAEAGADDLAEWRAVHRAAIEELTALA